MLRPLALLFAFLAFSSPGIGEAAAPRPPARAEARADATAQKRASSSRTPARRARKELRSEEAHRPRAGAPGERGHGPARRVAKEKVAEEKGAKEKGAKEKTAKEKTAEEKTAKEKVAKEKAVPAMSVGYPNEGRLEGGVRLDTSRKDIRVVPAYARGDVRWGVPALVGMIERAARGVARRFPGAVLGVGDLSRKHGGDVDRHGSHESGRDVDLAFYALDAKGKQVHASTFIRFDARLTSTNVRGARFDLPRNWALVQHLLTDPHAHVSHIFIAEPLRQALIAYAKRIGVSRALIVRAQLAMMQPTGAEPHDDHMHVRISCPRAMRGRCIELAKNAPSQRTRALAAKGLRTPGVHARKGAAGAEPARSGKSGTGRADAAKKVERRAEPLRSGSP